MTMGEVVNLRQVRKAKKRETEAAKADQNRLLHGRSKSQKEKERLERDHARRELDGKRRDSEPDDEPA